MIQSNSIMRNFSSSKSEDFSHESEILSKRFRNIWVYIAWSDSSVYCNKYLDSQISCLVYEYKPYITSLITTIFFCYSVNISTPNIMIYKWILW